ncbi:unnamed protein product, partial [Brachionus calyciflorus]
MENIERGCTTSCIQYDTGTHSGNTAKETCCYTDG